MLKIILIVIAIVAVLMIAFLAYAATKPDTFSIQRSININASAENIFPLINDFHQQSRWSPFDKDPNMKTVYSGPDSGVGATYEWDGNKDVGKGRIAITASSPNTKAVMQLDMIKPMQATNEVVFTLQPQGDATQVTWLMHGRQTFPFKVMGTIMDLFVDCDKMVGNDFEKGLNKLKTLAEQ